MKYKKSFTFIETLIVIGIIGILAGAIVVIVNPARRFEAARDRQREIHLQTILSAVERKMTVEGGWFDCPPLPDEVERDPDTGEPLVDDEGQLWPIFKTIGIYPDPDKYIDLYDCLIPKYMVNPLYDPKEGSEEDTKYQIWQNPQTKHITLLYYDDTRVPPKEIIAGATRFFVLRKPIVEKTGEITFIAHTWARVEGSNVTDDGGAHVFERGVVWAPKAELGTPEEELTIDLWDRTIDGEDTGTFTSVISNLEVDTEYSVRAYARNDIGVGYGGIKDFRTLAEGPAVETLEADPVTEDMARIRGIIYSTWPEGLSVEGWFCWWSAAEDELDCVETGRTAVQLGQEFYEDVYPAVQGTYYFRAWGEDEQGNSRYGEKKSFSTEITEPVVETLEAQEEDIKAYSARIGGKIVSHGGAAIIRRGVCFSDSDPAPCYNPDTYPGQCPEATEGALGEWDTGDFFVLLEDLELGVTYYFCAYAENNIGLSHGEPKEFTTQPSEPIVTTKEVTNITHHSADSGGEVEKDGGADVTQYGVCWSTEDPKDLYPQIDTDYCTNDGAGLGPFNSHIPLSETGLWGNTKYNVRAYAINEKGVGWGDKIEFTTAPPINPELTTTDPYNITKHSATSGGNITDHGGSEIFAVGICWGLKEAIINPDEELKVENQNGVVECLSQSPTNNLGEFTSTAEGLLPGREYYIRAYAGNYAKLGEYGYGGVKEFTTDPPDPPTAETGEVESSGVYDDGSIWVKISGKVTSDGGDPTTERGICYSDLTSQPYYGHPDAVCVHAGEGEGSFEAQIDNVKKDTTYYFRAFAKNATGTEYEQTGYGTIKNFKIETCWKYVNGVYMPVEEGKWGPGCTEVCRGCGGGDKEGECIIPFFVTHAAATALGCYAGEEACRYCLMGDCLADHYAKQGECDVCYYCGTDGYCQPQTAEYEDATALGCMAGEEACRRCDNGLCTYYTLGQHQCALCYACGPGGSCAGQTTDWRAGLYGCDADTGDPDYLDQRCLAGYCVQKYRLFIQSEPVVGIYIVSTTHPEDYSNYTNYDIDIGAGTEVGFFAEKFYEDANGNIYQFENWSGCVAATTEQTIQFTMPEENTTCTATYILPDFNLYVKSSPITGISIASGTNHGGITDYTKPIPAGSEVNLSTPATHNGYEFLNWSGKCVDGISTSRSIDFRMMTDLHETACTVIYAKPVEFINDVILDLDELAVTVYIAAVETGSRVSFLEIDGGIGTLYVEGIFDNAPFLLKTAGHRILQLTPAGGTANLVVMSLRIDGDGYIDRWWVLDATVSMGFVVGVPKIGTDYTVEVGDDVIGTFNSGDEKEITFTYDKSGRYTVAEAL